MSLNATSAPGMVTPLPPQTACSSLPVKKFFLIAHLNLPWKEVYQGKKIKNKIIRITILLLKKQFIIIEHGRLKPAKFDKVAKCNRNKVNFVLTIYWHPPV